MFCCFQDYFFNKKWDFLTKKLEIYGLIFIASEKSIKSFQLNLSLRSKYE